MGTKAKNVKAKNVMKALKEGRFSASVEDVVEGLARGAHSTPMSHERHEAGEALAFDDVLLLPQASDVLPSDTNTSSHFSRHIPLHVPLVSAAMDTVTESAMAIAMAREGGIGVIHKNLSIERHVEEVRRVKKYESGIVVDPLTIHPDQSLEEALSLQRQHNISGIPVVSRDKGTLVGILTNRDMRFVDNPKTQVKDVMTTSNLVTAKRDISSEQAMHLLHKHRIEKLLVVDSDYRCVGLITVKDIEKSAAFPYASKDSTGRLCVAAAVGVRGDYMERARQLVAAAVDALVIDSAHGHSHYVVEAARSLRQCYKDVDIVAGNVVTPQAARALIDVGVDGVKLGIGPGSICTTRIMAGVGLPQLTAILETAPLCRQHAIPLIADGGVRHSGDIAKALAAGADSVMVGSLFAGTKESPGETFLYQGRHYKVYRGMGSMAAMKEGGGERYFQGDAPYGQESYEKKWIPEGVEGQVPLRGTLRDVVYQMVGGLKTAMGYVGAATLSRLRERAVFRRMSRAGFQEGHVHDVTVVREAPNYPTRSS